MQKSFTSNQFKLGILGGGQLALMLATAAKHLNIEIICIDPNPECSAKRVTQVLNAEFTNKYKITNDRRVKYPNEKSSHGPDGAIIFPNNNPIMPIKTNTLVVPLNF